MEKFLLINPKEKTSIWLSILFFLLIPMIGYLDYLTGPEITFAFIYLLPVSAIAWLRFNAQFTIITAAFLTVGTWIVVDFLSGRFPFGVIAYVWNFTSRLLILLIAENLLSNIKKTHLQVYQISRRDPLTNALNSRAFKELAEHEIYRSMRSGKAMSIVFLDVDNFKLVNDTLGHSAGDELLIKIVKSINLTVRKSDVFARIGGDEFVILLPETGQDAAKIIIQKLRTVLSNIHAKENWPVTFSIGVLTCTEMPASADAMIGMADKLMYTVKASTKNGLTFSVYPENMESIQPTKNT